MSTPRPTTYVVRPPRGVRKLRAAGRFLKSPLAIRCLALALCAAPAWTCAQSDARVIDDFSDAQAWQAGASEDVKAVAVRGPQGGLCLRYDFGKVSGYAVLRRSLPLDLSARYAFVLRLRGQAPANALQFKLIDASGDNVWWMNRPGYAPARTSTDLVIRQRQIEFAWGPTTHKTLTTAAAIELVIARDANGQGGPGELCFEQLALRTLPLSLDAPSTTRSEGTVRGKPYRQLTFSEPRELNGVMLHAPPSGVIGSVDVQACQPDDGEGNRFDTLRRVRASQRPVLPLWLPETETRCVRVVAQQGEAPRLEAMDVSVWRTPNDMLASLARTLPRGRMPRAFLGEQNYWTIAGVDGGGAHTALVSEDGAIEPRKAGPSIEPFVIDDSGAVAGWADAQLSHSLRDHQLPIPQVQWAGDGYTLAIEVASQGTRERAQLIARYTLTNTQPRARRLTLALALRPWQVNPPQQFLNTAGGAVRIDRIAWRGDTLQVNGQPMLRARTPPGSVQAAAFDQGDPIGGAASPLRQLTDPQGLASAVLRWPMPLAPHESRQIEVVMPLVGEMAPAQSIEAIAAAWRQRLHHTRLAWPRDAQAKADTLYTALAHILISRDGPALQPGTRSYARSWIRDGAMMVSGLLRLGVDEPARDFVNWYAAHLFANGKVPCCVDRRGADPVAENDSHGEFIHAVAEVWRYTQDASFARGLWPKVDAAARYMEQLRQSERTPANREPGREAFFGLMPASISHEGYSAKPMHSYWDDFWALAGYRDAADLARALGHAPRAAQLDAQRAEFESDLAASLRIAIERHGIDHLPGAAELGDFDPSSSTMIFSPAGAEGLVPRAWLDATWNRYGEEVEGRRDGLGTRDDYTPYELRSVSSFLRLDQPERADALLELLMRDRRPAGWNQWAEVVGRDPRQVRFVGDMPHAWIASDYIRALLDTLVYERESDRALVIGAGLAPPAWREGGMGVQQLRTAYGPLAFSMGPVDAQTLRLQWRPLDRPPPGGVWLAWPAWPDNDALPVATIDGVRLPWQGRLVRLPASGGELRLQLQTAAAALR